MDKEGYVYLDVRSVPEFAAGHPTGAYNIPLLDMGPGGMAPNPDFLAVVQKSFPRDARPRRGVARRAGAPPRRWALWSRPASRTSWISAPVTTERPCPPAASSRAGSPKGLPTSTESAPDRTYDGLKKRG
jgi:hypothetical protein